MHCVFLKINFPFNRKKHKMLPYLNYQNRLKSNHGVPHCLDMCNGFRVSAGQKQLVDGTAKVYSDTALYVLSVRTPKIMNHF